jgi:antitoxin HigA-1
MVAEEFLRPLRMTQKALAKRIHVSLPRVNEIVGGKRSITSDTALRLARLFKTSPEFWLHGQLA